MRTGSMSRAAVLAAGVLALLAVVALAETVYVRVRSTNMFDRPDPLKGKTVGRLRRGDKLERLEKGQDWDKVRKGELIGYVKSRNLSTEKPEKSAKTRGKLAKWWVGSNRGPQNPETVGAEGLGKIGRTYTKKHNLEKGRHVVEEQMDKMYDTEPKVKAFNEKLEAFQRAGGLGDYAGTEKKEGQK